VAPVAQARQFVGGRKRLQLMCALDQVGDIVERQDVAAAFEWRAAPAKRITSP